MDEERDKRSNNAGGAGGSMLLGEEPADLLLATKRTVECAPLGDALNPPPTTLPAAADTTACDDGDAADEEADVGRALGAAGAGTGRCMFIAGFAYYEIGRFDFSVGRDGAYLELMTGAFVMSVVSASISGYVQYFMSGLEGVASGRQKQSLFALVLDEVVKANLLFFLAAVLFYCATFARIGQTYYPDAENGVYFAKRVPTAGAAVAFVGILVSTLAALRARTDLNGVAADRRGSTMTAMDISTGVVGKMAHRWSPRSVAVAAASSLAGESDYGRGSAGSQVASFLETADAIADRSIFIAGFAQSGLARYCPQGQGLDGSW
jgi:hypothetical protein